MKYIVLLCCILIPLTASPQEFRNARWWVNKSNKEKSEFVSGYLRAGSVLHKYYYQRRLREANTSGDSLIAGILYEHDKNALGLITHSSIDNTVKKLNKLYSDNRNLLIEFSDALVVVKMEWENGSRSDIEDKLISFRNKQRQKDLHI